SPAPVVHCLAGPALRILVIPKRFGAAPPFTLEQNASSYAIARQYGAADATPRFCIMWFPQLEFHHYTGADRGLASSKVGKPNRTRPATRHESGSEVAGAGWRPGDAGELGRHAVVPARRRDSTSAAPVWDIGVTVARFQPPRNVLFGHVLNSNRGIPHVRPASGILRKVRRTGNRISSVDRRKQGQISAGVVHLAAAHGEGNQVLMEPEAIVSHEAEKGLFWAARSAVAGYAATVFATRIARQ